MDSLLIFGNKFDNATRIYFGIDIIVFWGGVSMEEEVEIEMEELGLPKPEDVNVEGLGSDGDDKRELRRLVITNVARQSWLPTLGAGFFLLILGMFFLFVQFDKWKVDSVVSVTLIGNGLVLILVSRKESCIFDEREGKLQVRKLTWRGVSTTDYWLLHIKDVAIEEYKDPQVR